MHTHWWEYASSVCRNETSFSFWYFLRQCPFARVDSFVWLLVLAFYNIFFILFYFSRTSSLLFPYKRTTHTHTHTHPFATLDGFLTSRYKNGTVTIPYLHKSGSYKVCTPFSTHFYMISLYFIHCAVSSVVVFSYGKYFCKSFLCYFASIFFFLLFFLYLRIAAQPSSSICVPFKNAFSICSLDTNIFDRNCEKKELLIVWLLWINSHTHETNAIEQKWLWCQLAITPKSYCISYIYIYIALFKLD